MAYATFARTGLTAFYGFRMMFRLCGFEMRRTHRYLTSEQAIAIYRALWVGFLVCCCAMFWLGQECRFLVQPIVDGIVEDSLPADAPELPTATEQAKAIALDWWEYVRAVLGIVAESLRLGWSAIAQESTQAQVALSVPRFSQMG